MYNQFYGFSEKPFDVTSNPRFLYMTSGHKEALASLLYGIQEKRGILVLIGEVGTGKTTLLKAAINDLENSVKIAFVLNPIFDYDDLLETVLDAFDLWNSQVELSRLGKFKKLKQYVEFMARQGVNPVVIIDEAQNLDFQSLEDWRLLSNLENDDGKLIQIVLAGQPELENKLRDHRMRQLDQRISVRQYIGALSKKETFEYIEHRLGIVGSGNLFDRKSLDIIWKYSQGIPRKINVICDNALLIGFANDSETITNKITREAFQDLSNSPYAGSRGRKGRMDKGRSGFVSGQYFEGLAILWKWTGDRRTVMLAIAAFVVASILGMLGFFLKDILF